MPTHRFIYVPPLPPLTSAKIATSHLCGDKSEGIFVGLAVNGRENTTETYQGTSVKHLMRVDSAGNLDIVFAANIGTGFSHSALASYDPFYGQYPITKLLYDEAANRIIVCGMFDTLNGAAIPSGIVALDATTGLPDATWNPAGAGITIPSPGTTKSWGIFDIVLRSDGKYVVLCFDWTTGTTGAPSYNGTAVPSVFGLNSDGTLDTGFEGGFYSTGATSGVGFAAFLYVAPNDSVYVVLNQPTGGLNFYRWNAGTPSAYATTSPKIVKLDTAGAPVAYRDIIATSGGARLSDGMVIKSPSANRYRNTIPAYFTSGGDFVGIFTCEVSGSIKYRLLTFDTSLVPSLVFPASANDAFLTGGSAVGAFLLKLVGSYVLAFLPGSNLIGVTVPYSSVGSFRVGSFDPTNPANVTADVVNNDIRGAFCSTVAMTKLGKILIGSSDSGTTSSGIYFDPAASTTSVGFVRLKSDGSSDMS